MKKRPIPLHYLTFIALLGYCLSLTLARPSQAARQFEENISYELAISFDLIRQQLYGTAHVKIPAKRSLTLFLDGIAPTGIMLKSMAVSQPASTDEHPDHITIPQANVAQELFLSFEKTVNNHHDNFITTDGIVLLNNWYPRPSEKAVFSLKARIPEGFVALSESDTLPEPGSETVDFSFAQSTADIHFIAARFIVNSMKIRDNLSVYSYFLPEDQHLANGYLDSARAFILRYEEMIGKYPYTHFVIAENLRPTGYGMPTFTLLGKYVVRLPFIKDTSLGHEILHSWFGNSISVDYTQGNWCEGLTSYLADWLYRRDVGEGAINRKEQLLKYHSYVTEENAIPLQMFTSANHNQPMARAIRSVGYIKGAMFFHELRNLIGEELFSQGIRNFYNNYRNKSAGWNDIKNIFEDVSGEDLQRFFSERLQSDDTAKLELKDIKVSTDNGGTLLNFTVNQKSQQPFQITLPLRIDAPNWSISIEPRISKATETISLPLQSLPNRITIDPEYDVMRTLNIEEKVPTMSYFLGPRKPLVIAEKSEMADYKPFLDYSTEHTWLIKKIEELQATDITSEDLVLLGKQNSLALSLFGPNRQPLQGMTIEARRNPLNDTKYVLIVSADSAEEILKSLPKITHYGKYSYLHFQNGVLIDKKFWSAPFGHSIQLADEPKSIPTKDLLSYSDSMAAMLPARVIFLGESHTAMQDHYLQFLVIEKLAKENQDIAIGMEMFPASSQEVLDEYLLGNTEMDEKTFLKRSHYFQVWNYDYRYYKGIIDLARQHKIPLIGLNIERDIVSSIFKNGSTFQLSEEQKTLLPKERDLSLPGYSQRLRAVQELHPHGGSSKNGLSGFIQAQGVWDETMAQNIADYLRNNPTKKMVVIAGAEHARKDNGIPPRVLRRIEVSQTVAMTVNEERPPSPELADYFFYLAPQKLTPAGKIGISIDEIQKAGETFLKIVTLNPESNAGKSGLLSGDILLELDGFAVKSMEDLRIALVDKQAGDKITMKVHRGPDATAKVLDIDILLYSPEEAPHV